MRRLLAVIVLLGGVAFAGVDPEPKLYYSDVFSAPAGSYVCIAGRNLPTQASATVTLVGTSSTCNFCNSGCDDTFATYAKDTWTVGTADDHLCIVMPAAAGHCAGTVTGIKLNDGDDDSNTLDMARHSGTTYWVNDAVGNDSNSCTSDGAGNACLTLRGGADKMSTGDVMLVRTGTYDTPDASSNGPILWYSGTRGDPDGTPSKPMTIRGYPNEWPFVQNGENQHCRTAFNIGQDWVQIVGFETEGGKGNANGGDNNRWSGNKLDNANIDGCIPGGTATGSGVSCNGTYNKFVGNDMNDNDPNNNNLDHGVYLESSLNEVMFNEMTGNAFGVHLYDSTSPNINDNIVYSNDVHDNNKHGMLLGGGDRNIAYNNLIYDNGRAGIRVSFGDIDDTEIFNNTIYNNSEECIIVGGNGTAVGTIIKNNICYSNDGGDVIEKDSGESGTVESNNLLGTDPSFIDAPTDLHIEDGGAAIDYGTSPSSSRSVDYEMNAAPFGSSHDAGAYEWLDDVSTPPECGNNVREGAEVCDGTDLNSAACTDQAGFDCGTLSCAAGCAAFDTDECVATTACGNNVTDTIGDCDEFCDGTDLNGESCVDQGFECGALACNVGCTAFVTTGCEANCLESVIGTVTLEGVTID